MKSEPSEGEVEREGRGRGGVNFAAAQQNIDELNEKLQLCISTKIDEDSCRGARQMSRTLNCIVYSYC